MESGASWKEPWRSQFGADLMDLQIPPKSIPFLVPPNTWLFGKTCSSWSYAVASRFQRPPPDGLTRSFGLGRYDWSLLAEVCAPTRLVVVIMRSEASALTCSLPTFPFFPSPKHFMDTHSIQPLQPDPEIRRGSALSWFGQLHSANVTAKRKDEADHAETTRVDDG